MDLINNGQHPITRSFSVQDEQRQEDLVIIQNEERRERQESDCTLLLWEFWGRNWRELEFLPPVWECQNESEKNDYFNFPVGG